MIYEVLTGEPAERFMDDPGANADWSALAAADAKHTWFQEPFFCRTWYDVYRAQMAPVLVLARDGAELRGVAPLARSRSDGALFHAGGHQCEYQGWVADPSIDAVFPLEALRALRGAGVTGRWTWPILAPGAPLDWVEDIAPSGLGGVLVSDFESPMLDVHDEAFLKARMKGRLKTKSNQLRKRGAVYVRESDPEAAVETMKRLARWCDLRQGAARASMPFTADPKKLEFHLRLARDTEQVWMCALKIDGEPIAAHFGPRCGGELNINLPSYNPRESKSSPGLVLLAEMAQDLRAQGGVEVDLTPGHEDYKSRFATRWRKVTEIDIRASRAEATALSLKTNARRRVAGALRAVGVEPLDGIAAAKALLGRKSAEGPPPPTGEIFAATAESLARATPLSTVEAEDAMLSEARELTLEDAQQTLSAASRLWSEGWRPARLREPW